VRYAARLSSIALSVAHTVPFLQRATEKDNERNQCFYTTRDFDSAETRAGYCRSEHVEKNEAEGKSNSSKEREAIVEFVVVDDGRASVWESWAGTRTRTRT